MLQYTPQSRAERLIATGRVLLASFALLATWVDPSTAARHPGVFHALLLFYALYALLLAVVEYSLPGPFVRLRLLTHVLDLAVFTLFMFFAEGPTSPFFVYFVFSLVCATLRWQSRGTAWTAAAALATFLGLGVYAGEVLRDPAFELNRFIIRGVYLVVVATLLAYMGQYEAQVRGELSRLAAWPRSLPAEVQTLAREVLEHAAGVLAAPRVLLVWDEPEEPWRHLAWWGGGQFHARREPPTTFEPLMPDPLAGASVLCLDAGSPAPVVLYTSPEGLRRWRGEPCHPDLRARFAPHSLLALRLCGSIVTGRLFAFDKPGVTSDDLVLGEIVAQHAAARMDHYYLSLRLQQAAAAEERVRLARDLHDGVVQALSGAVLQLETVKRLVEEAPKAAVERLLEVQKLLAAEQRDLRVFIRNLKPTSCEGTEASSSLARRLEALGRRIERQWGLRVALSGEIAPRRLSERLAHEVYRIVHEALVNAARHANASAVRVSIGVSEVGVRIRVTDDGHGFPFRGRYDLARLDAEHLGPVTLRERVAALRGCLTIDSTEGGAGLEISLPVTSGAA